MVEDVKIVSWNWLRFKTKSLDYSMSHWCLNPRACLGDMKTWTFSIVVLVFLILVCMSRSIGVRLLFVFALVWGSLDFVFVRHICCWSWSKLWFLRFFGSSVDRYLDRLGLSSFRCVLSKKTGWSIAYEAAVIYFCFSVISVVVVYFRYLLGRAFVILVFGLLLVPGVSCIVLLVSLPVSIFTHRVYLVLVLCFNAIIFVFALKNKNSQASKT